MHKFFGLVSMLDSDVLSKVKSFAEQSHGEQMRKYAGERYINHLERVMSTCRQYTEDVTVLSAALLHDVLEDTPISEDQLSAFLSTVLDEQQAKRTAGMVKELTDVFVKKNYPDVNRRTRRTREAERLGKVSPDAQTIKYADIIDNVVDLGNAATDFGLVFMRECKEILKRANKGNPVLYDRAVKTVDDCLRDYFNKANITAL